MQSTKAMAYANFFFGILSLGIAIVVVVVLVKEGSGLGFNLGTALALGFTVNGTVRFYLSSKQRAQARTTDRAK